MKTIRKKQSIIQKRSTYDVSYLKHLLSDVTFVSYLNVFLNLPIFPRRVTYVPHKDSFNVEPVLLRKYLQTHHQKVLIWLCEERLPMFTKSHLYFHYKLCKAVCSDNPQIDQFARLETIYPDVPLIKDVCGFYKFHHYMLEGSGGILLKFWLAVEQLNSLHNDERAEFLERLFDDYVYVDSSQPLPPSYRAAALRQITKLCKGIRYVKRHTSLSGNFLQQYKDKLLRCKKLFRPIQDMILHDIRTYWINRYYLHLRKRLEDKGEGKRSGSSLIDLLVPSPTSATDNDSIDDDLTIPRSINLKFCTTNGLRRTSQLVYAQDLGVDISSQEYEEYYGGEPITKMQNDVNILENRMKNDCLKNRRRASVMPETETISEDNNQPLHRRASIEVTRFETKRYSLPGLSRRQRGSLTEAEVPVVRTGSLSLTPSRRSSSVSSLDTSFNSFDLHKMMFLEQMQSGRRPSGLQKYGPKSVEWARHAIGRTKVAVVEQYLEGELEIYRCCPCVLRDEIYQENYCDALKQVFNESSLKEVDVNNLLEVGIASDAIGGEDFKDYISRYSDQKVLYNYMFWVDIERFAYNYSTSVETMGCARGYSMNVIGFFSEKENLTFNWSFKKQNTLKGIQLNEDKLQKDLYSLLYKYTHPDGARYTDWKDPFTDSLWFAIVNNYSVQEWLALAQRYAAKKLLNQWLGYIEEKDNEFFQNCTILRHQRPPPPILHHTSEDLIYETMNSPNCQVMWAAMQLAEAIEYPGQHLPVIGAAENNRNLSPDHRSVISSLSSSVKSPSPSKLFSEIYQPPSRRMLTGIHGLPATSPAVHINEDVIDEAPPKVQGQVQGRRGDALILDTTLAQLEYNLHNTAGLDLSTDRLSTIPKNFLDLLRTRELLAKFRQFLLYNEDNHDASILFWQIVESLKSCRNPKQRQERMQFIAHKFFGPVSSMKTKLLMDKTGDVYKELCTIKKVTHTMLISAQTLIAKELESIYWLQFLEVLPAHIRERIMCMASRNLTEKKEFGKEKNRKLWVNFTLNVINFKHGIMDPEIYKHFKKFLNDYVREIALKCTKNTQKRQVVNNKLIDIEKIEADLDFFIEVEKYKEICDSVQTSARMGNYDPKEEEMSMQKGRVLYACYIDSILPPKVQINISHDKVSEIRKLHESGLFERGMFHDAALSIFPILTHFWKRFCLQRYAPVKVKISDSDKLILNARKPEGNRKGMNKPLTPVVPDPSCTQKPGPPNAIIQVPHVAQGIIHLLNRYTESSGLSQFACQNNPNVPTHKPINRMQSEMSRCRRSVDDSELAEGLSKDVLGPLGILNLMKDDRKLSVLGSYVDRRASIMSPRRCSTVRQPSFAKDGSFVLPDLLK